MRKCSLRARTCAAAVAVVDQQSVASSRASLGAGSESKVDGFLACLSQIKEVEMKEKVNNEDNGHISRC